MADSHPLHERFLCSHCDTLAKDPAPSVVLAEGDEMTMVEIPKSVYDSLLSHKETVEALDELCFQAAKRHDELCIRRFSKTSFNARFRESDTGVITLKDDIKLPCRETLPAAILALRKEVGKL